MDSYTDQPLLCIARMEKSCTVAAHSIEYHKIAGHTNVINVPLLNLVIKHANDKSI